MRRAKLATLFFGSLATTAAYADSQDIARHSQADDARLGSMIQTQQDIVEHKQKDFNEMIEALSGSVMVENRPGQKRLSIRMDTPAALELLREIPALTRIRLTAMELAHLPTTALNVITASGLLGLDVLVVDEHLHIVLNDDQIDELNHRIQSQKNELTQECEALKLMTNLKKT